MERDFTVPADWYQNFFTGPVNRFWEAMVPEAATKADLAFVIRQSGLAPAARILDLPCGAGRHALGLARQGYRVTGVDISHDAVERAASAAKREALPAHFTCADMRFFEAEEPFDAAICMGNSIGYFEPDGTADFFRTIAASLRPGAWLVLDSYCCAESVFPLKEDREIPLDGGSYRSQLSYDPLRSVLKTKAQLTLNGEVHPLLYAHQVMTSGELVRLLGEAGLRTEGLYGDTEGAPFQPGSPRLLLVARRG
jgi:SAM-dependent methyltransferase